MPPRKLLKDDAIPTLFDYNRDKQSSKRKTSCGRLEIVNMNQLCGEAFEHYDRWENLEMEINSKGVQAKQEMTSRKPAACNFIKKEAPPQVFFSEFCETSKNTFFIEHLHYRLLLE